MAPDRNTCENITVFKYSMEITQKFLYRLFDTYCDENLIIYPHREGGGRGCVLKRFKIENYNPN